MRYSDDIIEEVRMKNDIVSQHKVFHFPLLFPLCYIVPPVFMNSDKGKYKGKKII